MSFILSRFPKQQIPQRFYLPRGTAGGKQVISFDNQILANIVEGGLGFHVEINGVSLKTYDFVSGVTISQDSQHIAYMGQRGFGRFVVFDEVESKPWDDIGITSPEISPDGKHVAYTARKGREWFALLDHEIIGGPYEGFGPGGIAFSPDSQRTIYSIKQGQNWHAVVDGKKMVPFPTIYQKSWGFTPDSSKAVYIAGITGTSSKEGFVGKASVVIDERIDQVWEVNGITKESGFSGEVYFSPDSQRMAYYVVQNGKTFFVIDGKVQESYDGCSTGRSHPNWQQFPGFKKASWRRKSMAFSPDSRHYAYGVNKGNKHFIVFDGEEQMKHKSIIGTVGFSPDSTKIAYGVDIRTFQYLMVNDTPLKKFFGIPPMDHSFSPDSEHIAYIASQQSGKKLLAIDSSSLPIEGDLFIGSQVVWDNNSECHLFVLNDREVKIERFDFRENKIIKTTKTTSPKRSTPIYEENLSENDQVKQLLVALDGARTNNEILNIEEQLVALGEGILKELLTSIDELIADLLNSVTDKGIERLGIRIRILGRLGNTSLKVIQHIGSALSDSAVYHEMQKNSPFYFNEGAKLNQIASDAFVNLGEDVIPYLEEASQNAVYEGGDPYKNMIVRRSFRRVLKRLKKRWWEFWV